MTSFTRISLAALFSLSLTGLSTADEPLHPLPRPVFAAGVSAPVAGYYGPRHFGAASTAHESILRGHADVIRARGENALLTAEALRSLEEAKSRFLDNEVKRLAVRQERMRMGMTERAERYAEIQARRETQMALNRAAREMHEAAGPHTAALHTNVQAKLQRAKQLLNEGQVESGVIQLQLITEQFTQTAAAREAATILNAIRG